MDDRIYEVAIVEDLEEHREFLRDAINDDAQLNCAHQYANAEEAITFLPKAKVDVALVDIRLPRLSGIDCVRQVKLLKPHMLFAMYTVLDQNDKIFESLKAGANGYLLKSSEERIITSSIKELIYGGAPMSPEIARRVTDYFKEKPFLENREISELRPREREVLELLSKGLLYKEIAFNLGLTVGTVKQHIHNIYKTLHVQNRTEAVNLFFGRRDI